MVVRTQEPLKLGGIAEILLETRQIYRAECVFRVRRGLAVDIAEVLELRKGRYGVLGLDDQEAPQAEKAFGSLYVPNTALLALPSERAPRLTWCQSNRG